MATNELRDKLVDYIQDAHAMEQTVLRMLDGMISTTHDPEIRELLEHHQEETRRHEERLRERLQTYGKDPSRLKEASGLMAAMAKGLGDFARPDKPGRNARDGYAAEHMEIAAYELLERLARRAGDEATAELARQNCADERAMARQIEAHWDKFVEMTLADEGLIAAARLP